MVGDSVTVRMEFLRSPRKEGEAGCTCCPDGEHVFSSGFVVDPPVPSHYYADPEGPSGRENITVREWLDNWRYRHLADEGKTVRITVEVVEGPAVDNEVPS